MKLPNINPGDVFGRWTVIRELPRETGKHLHARVRCSCLAGTIRDVRVRNLLAGQSRSCGCLSREGKRRSYQRVRVGERYGAWTITQRLKPKANGKVYFRAQCTCSDGTVEHIYDYAIKAGTARRDCGCGLGNAPAHTIILPPTAAITSAVHRLILSLTPNALAALRQLGQMCDQSESSNVTPRRYTRETN